MSISVCKPDPWYSRRPCHAVSCGLCTRHGAVNNCLVFHEGTVLARWLMPICWVIRRHLRVLQVPPPHRIDGWRVLLQWGCRRLRLGRPRQGADGSLPRVVIARVQKALEADSRRAAAMPVELSADVDLHLCTHVTCTPRGSSSITLANEEAQMKVGDLRVTPSMRARLAKTAVLRTAASARRTLGCS